MALYQQRKNLWNTYSGKDDKTVEQLVYSAMMANFEVEHAVCAGKGAKKFSCRGIGQKAISRLF